MSKIIIDVSNHNGNIDFEKVKNAGVSGVIIRAGWIGNKQNHTVDLKFQENYEKAKNAGLEIGFYVYSYCKSVETVLQGTDWLINKIRDKEFTLPVFLDLEDSTIKSCGKENLTNQAVEFCKRIESSLGKKAGIYANKYWFANLVDVNSLTSYKIWLAEWNGKENHTANFNVDLWQYTSNGSVNGILGRVDMNKCLNCQNAPHPTETPTTNSENTNNGGYEMKTYKNGSTKEVVYQDTSCQKSIGYLNPYETAQCFGIVNNLALVVYNVDKKGYKKTGFCKWLGGIK